MSRFHLLQAGVFCLIGVADIPASHAQSTNIPLNFSVNNFFNYGARNTSKPLILTINVGIGQQPARAYAFDTGSFTFLAPDAVLRDQESATRLASDIVIDTYGSAQFSGGIYQLPSSTLHYYSAPNMTSGGVTLGAESSYNVASYTSCALVGGGPCAGGAPLAKSFGTASVNVRGPGGETSTMTAVIAGVFGADGQASGVDSPNPVLGSVLGQAITPGATAGFVVSANGQNLAALNEQLGTNIAGGLAATLGEAAKSAPKALTGCDPCLTVGLTPAILAQFSKSDVFFAGADPSKQPFPYSDAPSINKFIPFGRTSVTDADGNTTRLGRLNVSLDTGWGDFALKTDPFDIESAVSLTVGRAPPAGETFAIARSPTGSPSPYKLSTRSEGTVFGIGFFVANSVLFDLVGKSVGYSRNFVTSVNIPTAQGANFVVDETSVPLGLAGIISGQGGLSIKGGAATLSAGNTYTGPTTIDGGYLALVGQGDISASSGVNIKSGGVFDISGAYGHANTRRSVLIASLTGDETASVILGANDLMLTNASGTFAGSISDGGGLIDGQGGSILLLSGTEIFSGSNSYTRPTTVSAGALIAANPGALSATSTTTIMAGGTVDLGGTTQVINNVTLSGGILRNGALTGTVTSTGGAISGLGGGAVVNLISGVTKFGGASSFTGGVTVAGGATAAVTSSAGLGAGAVTLQMGSMMTLGDGVNVGNRIVAVGDPIFDVATNAVATISGAITDVTPPGPPPGVVEKTGDGALILTGANSYSGGTKVIAGSLRLAGAGAIGAATGATEVSGGTLDIGSTHQTQNGGVTLSSGSIAIAKGGVLAATTLDIRGGTFVTEGAVKATTSITNAATMNAQGAITTPKLINKGLLGVAGQLNSGGGLLGALDNSGLVAINAQSFGGVTTFNNAGTLQITTGALGAATLNNAATLDLRQTGLGVSGAAILTGNYFGQANSLIAINASGAAQQTNKLIVSGTADGSSRLDVTVNPGNLPVLSSPSTFLQSSGGALTFATPTVNGAAQATTGLFSFTVLKNGNDYQLYSAVNGAAVGGLVSGVMTAVDAAQTGFFLGSGGFVDSLPTPPSSPIGDSSPRRAATLAPNSLNGGVWTRDAVGVNVEHSRAAFSSGGVSLTTPLSTNSRFNGEQVGADVSVSNIAGSGWNLHAGVTGGEYDANSSSGGGATGFRVPFVGVYGALTGHGFDVSLLVRHDFWYGNVSSPSLALSNARMNGNGDAVTGGVGYRLNLSNGAYLRSMAGFSYSLARFDSLSQANGSAGNELPPFTLSLGKVTSKLGVLSLQAGYPVRSGDWLLVPDLVVSGWREFAGPISGSVASLDTGGNSPFNYSLSTSRVGSFAQIGVGIAASPTKLPDLTMYLRADFRSGAEIGGGTISFGARYTF